MCSHCKSCGPSCAVAEIPDDVVNFFNNTQSSAVHYNSNNDDDDVGLLQFDVDNVDDGRTASDGHVNSGNLYSNTIQYKRHLCSAAGALMFTVSGRMLV